MADSRVVRVAVIGAGNMGRNHIRTYKQLKGVQLVGLADINAAAEHLAKEYDVNYYSNYKQMLDIETPDAVSIVVPTQLHHKIGLDVIRRGIHCLIEKPIASSVKEADEIINVARENGIVLTVGHIEHYSPMIQKLKELIDNKKIGHVTSIVCKRVGGFPSVEPKTDVIIDLAVHDLGVMSYLLGCKPNALYSHGSRTLHSAKIDAAEILLDFGRASGFVQANWITPVKVRTISVTGTKGYIEGNYITQELVHYEHNMKRAKDQFESFVLELGEPKKYAYAIKLQEPLAVELSHFIKRIKGDESVMLVKPEEAREALSNALQAVERYEK